MATLRTRLSELITAIGTDWKNIWANTGDRVNLNTTTKANLVAAINEVNSKPSGTGGANINDTSTNSTTETYSVSKIVGLDGQNLKLTGAQTVAGVKTFTSAPVVPDGSWTIGATNGLQGALDAKAPLASPSFTGTPTGITKGHVGLGNVDNTSDANKPVSTAQQTALNLKLDNTGGTLSGNLTLAAQLILSSVTRTANFTLSTASPIIELVDATTAAFTVTLPATTTAGVRFIFKKTDATVNNVTLAGTIDGVVNYTLSGVNSSLEVVSTTVSGAWRIVGATGSKAQVGLGNVDNTSDVNKPVSTAQAAAIAALIADGSATTATTTTYSANKINAAIAAATAALVNASPAALDTLNELAAALGNDANFATTTSAALGNRLRIDIANQGLTLVQQQNGRTNLDAYGSVELGNPDTDLVALYVAAKA